MSCTFWIRRKRLAAQKAAEAEKAALAKTEKKAVAKADTAETEKPKKRGTKQ